MLFRHLSKLLAVIFVMGTAIAVPTSTQLNPVGFWLTGVDEETGKRRAKVEIYPCGNKLCGKIVALAFPNDPKTGKPKMDPRNSSQPLIGSNMLTGMVADKDEPNKWVDGEVYDAQNDKTYSGHMTMSDNNNLELRGYVLGIPALGRSQNWIRTSPGPQM